MASHANSLLDYPAQAPGRRSWAVQEDSLSCLLDDLLPPGRGVVAVLKAYFDESGTHEGARITSVGGYLFEPEPLRRFNREWKRALDKAEVEFFHMAEFGHLGGPFKGISMKRANILQATALTTIKRRVRQGFVVALSEREYRVAATPEWRAWYGSTAYLACVQFICQAVGYYVTREYGPAEPVAYVFEGGAPHMQEAADKMVLMSTRPDMKASSHFHSGVFADKKTASALQAADILAWHYCKVLLDTVVDAKRPMRKDLEVLLSIKGQHNHSLLHQETLRRLIAENPVPKVASKGRLQ